MTASLDDLAIADRAKPLED